MMDDATLTKLAERVAAKLAVERDRLLDRRDLAGRLGVCERSVGALAARGEIPAGYRIGGVRRWDWSEVKRYLDRNATKRPRKGRGIR